MSVKKENIFNALDGISSIVRDSGHTSDLDRDALFSCIVETKDAFEADWDGFSSLDISQEETKEYLRQWHVMGDAPSLVMMVTRAMEDFGVRSQDLHQATLMAAVLGEAPHDLDYHNVLHFKKVTLQMIRMITAHNDIYRDTGMELNESDVATLLSAACIHDLGHDGKGNTLEGVHEPGRLERYAHTQAAPYLKDAGAPQEFLDRLKVMLLCTDVSPIGDAKNFANQMKAAYRFHFMDGNKEHTTLNLTAELAWLEKDPKLALMACMLHEADIATSAGVDYAVTQYETLLFRAEMAADETARPQHVLDFLKNVCDDRFLTASGKRLFAGNMERIRVLAEHDVKHNGNEPFPEPQHSDFILGLKDEAPKTLS